MSQNEPSMLSRSEQRRARRLATGPLTLPSDAPPAPASEEPFRATVRTLGAFDRVRAQLAELGAETPADN